MASEITQAVVYLSGAQITRTRTFKLKSGTNKVAFGDLPLDMNGRSITASSDGKCFVQSVSHSTVYAKTENKRISELYAKLEKLKGELSIERSMFGVLTEEENLIRKNAQTPDGKTFRSEDMKDAVLFFRERMASLCGEKFESQKKIEKLSYEISKIESQIGADDRGRRRSQVEIEVHCDGDTESELTISYFIHNARWIPYYDIRVKDIGSPLSLASKAIVYQNTGEDWNNIDIILSTGNPSLSGNLPDLRPWYIDFYVPYAPEPSPEWNTAYQAAPSMRLRKSAEMPVCADLCVEECASDALTVKPAAPLAVQTESVASVEYTLPVPYTVLSSETGKTVDILTHELKASYQYRCVRKLEKDVFLVAEVKDWTHLNLLAGNANVFFEDKYVGEIHVDPRKAEEGLRISLGRDKNIIVTRVRGKDYTSTSTMGSSAKASREWTINARNLRKQDIDITIEDQIPVSANKDITVDAVNVSGAELDKETGKLTWKFTLSPADSKVLSVKYMVTYPKNRTVILE
ncbi:MAG: DUF4139 domain-containing protein [Methanomassiliicoccaceae archaeon]|nr:DUF4139 domain-containing protein [Methanomassiliicoccaceae archaeon]